ncbi:MAG: Chromosome (plasmid) partitioning protein ParA, partial [uncultured Blastococcus sp.]
EGRRRQDDVHGEPGRGPGALRTADAGHRPGPAGQRQHGPRRRAHGRDAVDLRRPGGRVHAGRGGAPDDGEPGAVLRAGDDRPRRRGDRAGLGRGPRAPAAPGDRGLRRGPARRPAAALRAHRLPALARAADAQRAGGRRRGAHPDPVRVLRAGGPGPAAQQHRPGAPAPQPGHRRPHDPADHVRRAHPARRPGRRRGAQALRGRRAEDGHPPHRPRRRGAGLRAVRAHLRPGLARLHQLRGGRARAGRARGGHVSRAGRAHGHPGRSPGRRARLRRGHRRPVPHAPV